MPHDPITGHSFQPCVQRADRSTSLLVLICCLVYSIASPCAYAAEIVVDRDRQPVIVTVLGTLVVADTQKFLDRTSGLQKAIVMLASDGGSVIAGISIGKTIRARNFETAVPDGVRCASACALAWLGGTSRFMSAGARVGFHAAYTKEGGTVQESGVANALVGSYLARLGLSDTAIVYITSAHPDEMQWLTMSDARQVGIEAAPLTSTLAAGRDHQPTPQISPPQGPSPPVSTLEAKARAFIGMYFGFWSLDNFSAMTFVSNIYGDPVHFYGKLTPKKTIVDMKRAFVQRWPGRAYSVQWNSLTINCDQQNMLCVVIGLVDWECRSPARGARSAGLSNFAVGVQFASNGTQYIYYEESFVVTRTAGQ